VTRSCPLCERQPLERRLALDVELDVCPRCHGIWFDKGELEAFPDRPSVRALLPAARHAPGRCRRKGHAIPRSMAGCPTCGSAAAVCPTCQMRLSMVTAGTCSIEICVPCQGVWLDAGELQRLEAPALRPLPTPAKAAGALTGWEIPEATDVTGPDPYRAPGQLEGLGQLPTRINGLICRHCETQLSGEQAFAFDGEVYCASCRPEGAVSGMDATGWLDRMGSWFKGRSSF
jgi:Zn-finger nucleic acid-binding protein